MRAGGVFFACEGRYRQVGNSLAISRLLQLSLDFETTPKWSPNVSNKRCDGAAPSEKYALPAEGPASCGSSIFRYARGMPLSASGGSSGTLPYNVR